LYAALTALRSACASWRYRNYTVEEIAKLFGVHRNTVRQWVKQGLPTSDRKRPMLILGREYRRG